MLLKLTQGQSTALSCIINNNTKYTHVFSALSCNSLLQHYYNSLLQHYYSSLLPHYSNSLLSHYYSSMLPHYHNSLQPH